MRPLIWFRNDLRVNDNTALLAACNASDNGAVALFVISPGEWQEHEYAPVKIDLILRSLRLLQSSLEKLRIPLVVIEAKKRSDVSAAVIKTAKACKCDAIYYNKEYEVNEAIRDATLDRLASKDELRVYGYSDQVVIEPGQVRTGDGKYYTVFTPFKKNWIKTVVERGIASLGIAPGGSPRRVAACEVNSSLVPDEVIGFRSTVPQDTWPAGEAHATKLLHTFCASAILHYKEARNYPSKPATSSLSPYLTVGCISPRQCFAAAVEANSASKSPLDSGNVNIATWISELIWREFYVNVMVGFPRVCKHRAFQPATEKLRWNNNPEHLKAWQRGMTGVPIVDAGIRQLLAIGWMHNRVRMIVAMYLTKNLFLDWRLGESFFMRHLVDGFLASNNGGWQWSASTGTDAAPYFRIFNPVSQSEKFDASGSYIRRWVPELASLDSEVIHAPWDLVPMARIRLDYPAPLVDLTKSRAAAIEAFQAVR